MLRVLHVIPAVAPRYGGPSRAVYEMCRALHGQGIDTSVATTDADGRGRQPRPAGTWIRHQDVPTIFFPRQWSEALKYSHPLGVWLSANVRHYDLVHIHAVFSHSSLVAAKACSRDEVPYLIRPLGSLDPWSLSQKRLQKRLLFRLGFERMLKSAAAIHYTTEAERRLAEGVLNLPRGVVIPLGTQIAEPGGRQIQEEFRRRFSLGDSPYVLVLSRLDRKKRLELLIEAFLTISDDSLRHWRLVLAGEGQRAYVRSLKNLADQRAADQRVILTGWLEGEERQAALAGSELLALASRQENFGLAVVEALSTGTPVLVSRYVNLAAEIEQERAGWIADNLEVGAIAAVLREALLNQSERRKRGHAGRRLVEARFNWPNIASRLAEVYRSLLGSSSSVNRVKAAAGG